MLLWVLCVKLWWLLLPWGGHGLPSESRTQAEREARSLSTEDSAQGAGSAIIEQRQQKESWEVQNFTNLFPGVAKSTTPLNPQDAISAVAYTGPADFVRGFGKGDEWSFHWRFGDVIVRRPFQHNALFRKRSCS